MARLAAWAALALLALYLVFFGGGWQGIYRSELRSITITLAGFVLAAWAIVAWRRPDWRPRSVLLPAILACVASLAMSTAFSQHPRLSVEYLGYTIILAALYLLLVRILANPWFRARMATLTVSLFVVVSGLFVALVISHWIDWWGIVGRVTFPPLRPESESLTYGNPSAVMTVSFLLACAAAAAIGLGSQGRRVQFVIGALLVAVVTVMSGSRSGWLAVVAAIGLTIVLALIDPRQRPLIASTLGAIRRSRAAVSATALILVGGAVLAVALAPALLLRFTAGGENLRLGHWISALRMFAEAPIVGFGPGMWAVNRVRETHAPEPDYYVPHAHDIYLQTLAELGLLGALAGLVLTASLVWLVRGAIGDRDATRRRWGWAACLSLLYFAAHQVLDLYVNMPAIMLAAALPVAWLDATASADAPHPWARWASRIGAPARQAAIVVSGVVVAASVVGLLAAEGPAQRHADAVALANRGDWIGAVAPARDAVEQDPAWPPYLLTLGLVEAHAGDHAAAADAFRRAAELDDFPESWLNLAAEQAELGQRDDALDSIARALRLGYQRTAISAAAGDLALRLDATEVATDAFAWAIADRPSFAGDPWWSLDPARSAVLPDVVNAAIERAGVGVQWEIAAMAGDLNRARTLATALDAESRELANDVIDALAGDSTAFDAVIARCEAQPLAGESLIWCSRLSALRGDEAEANRYRAWGFPVGVGYASQSELRVSEEELVGRRVEGGLASFYGTYTYRRPTPWDLLVPSLIHLTVK